MDILLAPARALGHDLVSWVRLGGLLALLAILASAAVVVAEPEVDVAITSTVEPTQLQVQPGTTVTWLNRDDERHRLRSKDGPEPFDSKNLEPGESFSYTFAIEGSYPYYDHRDRDDARYFGMVIVSGAEAADAGPLPETGDVSIIDRSFQPGPLSIATGGTIEWSNDDGEAHTVTATDGAFDSGILNGGASFAQTFSEPGNVGYFCLIHPEMRGAITVSDPVDSPVVADPAEETPPESSIDAVIDVLATEAPTDVSMVDRSFQPDDLEVVVGDSVLWANDDTEGHTVTATDGAFNSGVMTVGDEFSLEFDSAGTFDYFCAIHPEMKGTIRVAPALN